MTKEEIIKQEYLNLVNSIQLDNDYNTLYSNTIKAVKKYKNYLKKLNNTSKIYLTPYEKLINKYYEISESENYIYNILCDLFYFSEVFNYTHSKNRLSSILSDVIYCELIKHDFNSDISEINILLHSDNIYTCLLKLNKLQNLNNIELENASDDELECLKFIYESQVEGSSSLAKILFLEESSKYDKRELLIFIDKINKELEKRNITKKLK